MSASRGIRVGQALLLCLGALACVALLLEGSLRLLWDGYYRKHDPAHPWSEFQFHPTRGFALVPGLSLVDWDADFQVLRRHNSRGFRSPEIDPAKPPGRIRVLVTGDSMVYGTGVENDETFCARMEQLDPRLQVVNAGVPAYSGAEEIVQLREEIDVWAPDVVLAAFFWNDLFGAYPGRYVRFRLEEGRLVEEQPEPASPDHPAFDAFRRRHEKQMRPLSRFAQESYLYRLVSDRWKLLVFATRDLRARLGLRERKPFDREAERAEDAGELAAAWDLSLALLGEMARLAESRGARFAILVVPDSVQVEPDPKVYGVPDYLFSVQERVGRFAALAGLPLVDPLPQLREIRRRDGEPLHHPTDRHWNPAGHRHVARLLVDALEDLGFLEPG